MATVPPITVPVVADLIGGDKPMFADKRLKCCPCTDNAITNDTPIEDVPVATTMAPSILTFNVGGQQVNAPCTIPVCVPCRRRQMGIVSKTGLIVT